MKRILAALFLFLAARSVAAQQLDQFERILLPVEPVFELFGSDRSYGSSVSYASSQQIAFYPALGEPLGIGELAPSPGDTLRIKTKSPSNAAGRFLFVEKGAAADLELALNLYTGGNTSADVATVPVVRDSQFRTRKVVLPGIRLTKQINCVYIFTLCSLVHADRLKLYVYDADGTGTNKVSVRIWRGQQRLLDGVLALDQHNGSDPSYPYYGQLEYSWDDYNDPYVVATVSVELQPLQEHVRYWPFAIVIPSHFFGVTVYSPRP